MEVQEIMTKDVISVSPTMPTSEAIDLLLRHRIHGAPVVDGSGRLLGMVSFVDLAARSGVTVQDIMVTDPVWAPSQTNCDCKNSERPNTILHIKPCRSKKYQGENR